MDLNKLEFALKMASDLNFTGPLVDKTIYTIHAFAKASESLEQVDVELAKFTKNKCIEKDITLPLKILLPLEELIRIEKIENEYTFHRFRNGYERNDLSLIGETTSVLLYTEMFDKLNPPDKYDFLNWSQLNDAKNFHFSTELSSEPVTKTFLTITQEKTRNNNQILRNQLPLHRESTNISPMVHEQQNLFWNYYKLDRKKNSLRMKFMPLLSNNLQEIHI